MRFGVLNIESAPEGASIYIDSKDLGLVTPAQIDNLLVGRHKIELKKPGYKPYIKRIVIKKGETISINALLIRKLIKLNYNSIPDKSTPCSASEFLNNC